MIVKTSKSSNNCINFKSHDFKTTYTHQSGDVKVYNHYTYLGRDLKDSVLLSNLTQSTFPNGATIIDYGASTGEEAYTLAMLFGQKGKLNPKYPIKAFDIAPQAVDIANQGIFAIARTKTEGNIVNPDYYLNHQTKDGAITHPLKKLLRGLFEQHFQQADNLISSRPLTNAIYYDSYKASDDFKQNISFNVGDVEKIGDLKPQDIKPPAGVVIFKNSWSYLFNNEKGTLRVAPDNSEAIFAKVRKVVDAVAKILPQNGLFAVGDCPYDYIVMDETEKMITPSPLVKILQDKGFEPVKDSMKKISLKAFSDRIPTIWRKA